MSKKTPKSFLNVTYLLECLQSGATIGGIDDQSDPDLSSIRLTTGGMWASVALAKGYISDQDQLLLIPYHKLLFNYIENPTKLAENLQEMLWKL